MPGAANSQAYDRYAYVMNNPLLYTDPSGHYRMEDDPGNPGHTDPGLHRYWRGMNISKLAKYQQDQKTTNNCALNSIASAINLIYQNPRGIEGDDLAARIDKNWSLRYRLYPGQATLPKQQMNIINDITQQGGLNLDASISKPDMQEMIDNLQDGRKLQLVTLIWGAGSKGPDITKGNNSPEKSGGDIWTGHTMVLVAYDTSHTDNEGNERPWGFVNSWTTSGKEIYWMSDLDMYLFSSAVTIINKQMK